MTLALSPQVFAILTALIEQRCGIHYPPSARELLAHKATPRAFAAGFESMLDYYYFLRYDPGGPAELDALIESLVVHESYLFREAEPLEVLVRELLEPWVRAGQRPRVWSAACASGEEPFTLAMMLAHRDLLARVDIVASDISARVLERARRGVLGRRAVRAEYPAYGARYVEIAEQEVRVAPELIARIDWRRVNLASDAEVAALPRMDAVLCRNVLIYFSDDGARAVVRRIVERMNPAAALLVGVSESLMRFGTMLACEEHGGAFLYRRSAA